MFKYRKWYSNTHLIFEYATIQWPSANAAQENLHTVLLRL